MNEPLFRWINRSFSGKVFAAMLGVLVLLTCTFTVYSLMSQRDNFKQEILRDGRLLAQMMADNARLGIFAKDNRQLAGPVEAAMDVRGVIGACVFDQEGNLMLRQASPAWEQKEICLRLRQEGEELTSGPGRKIFHVEDELTEEFWSAVMAKPGEFSEEELFFPEGGDRLETSWRIGTVGVIFDRSLLRQYIRDTLVRHAMILILFLGIGIFAAYSLVEAVSRPLNRLINSIRTQGGLVEARDDLCMLSDTFDSMVKTLGDSFATINELKSGLERKVDELELEIRKRELTEAALRESEKKFRDISEGIADGVAIVRDGTFVWVNRAFCTIFDSVAPDLLGREAMLLLPQPGRLPGNPWLKDCLGGTQKDVRFLTMTRRSDGQEIMIEVKAQLVVYEKREAIQVIIRDITDQDRAETRRKEMEVKALAQSKLASLGKIATGVAHEINQPLSYIRVAYESALRDMNSQRFDPGESRETFQEALRQVGRITMITEHLRNFGRADTSVFSEVQLPEVLTNSLALMGEILRQSNIALEREIAGDLPMVMGNSVQLEQIFINLFQNSADAMRQTGEKKIRVIMRLVGEMIEIRCSDSGPGIPAAAQERIFEPFYSTKSGEDRTGLGLAIVNTIVREHGGTIAYREESGWGANFVILLPVCRETDDPSVAPGKGADNI